MQIVIAGVGIVGFNLAEELSRDGHDIFIIDNNPEKIKYIKERLDVMAIEGDCCRPSVLANAGIKSADIFISVTNSDEVNITSSLIVHSMGIKNNITRIRNEELSADPETFLKQDVFINKVINTESILIDFINKVMETPGATDVADFADGKILLRGFTVSENAPIAGRKLMELKQAVSLDMFLIVAIIRDNNIIIPKGNDVIKSGDNIYILMSRDTIMLILPMLTKKSFNVQSITIYGGNHTACKLASILVKKGKSIRIIEHNKDICKKAASALSNILILNGSGTDSDLLKEAEIESTDFFIAMSDDDQSNLLSALMAKKLGARKVIVVSQQTNYLPVLGSLDFDVVISPRLITASAILKYIRKGEVRSLVKIKNNMAEAIEISIPVDSKVIDKPLSKISFPEGSIVGAIIKDGEMVIPDGNSTLTEGMRVIIFALTDSVSKIEKLFNKKTKFFNI